MVQRQVLDVDTCRLCTRTKETAIHALWECNVAGGVWAQSTRRVQKSMGGQVDILQLATELLHKLSQEEFELFLVRAWLIWNQRNSVTHGGSIQDST